MDSINQKEIQHKFHKILIIGNNITYNWEDFKEADLVIYLRDDYYEIVKPDDMTDDNIGQYNKVFNKYNLFINHTSRIGSYNDLILLNFAIKLLTPNTFQITKNRFGPQGENMIGKVGELYDIELEWKNNQLKEQI